MTQSAAELTWGVSRDDAACARAARSDGPLSGSVLRYATCRDRETGLGWYSMRDFYVGWWKNDAVSGDQLDFETLVWQSILSSLRRCFRTT